MSSIAYVTDRDMIEYHRLHGSTRMVFWRPSGQKHFQYFHHGDYLFFLSKGTEKGINKEKGIIGYGRYEQDDRCSISVMWKKYGTQCGYGEEAQLKNAIIKMNKNHQLPQKIQCLILTDMIFFQTPVYMSELNMNIPKQLESYLYLDRELCWNILSRAQQTGIDLWSHYVEKHNHPVRFDQEIMFMQEIQRSMAVPEGNYEKKKLAAFAKKVAVKKHGTFLAGANMIFAGWEDDTSCFYFPCMTSLKQWKQSLLVTIAKAQIGQAALKEKNSPAKVCIVLEGMNHEAEILCRYAAIAYEIHK